VIEIHVKKDKEPKHQPPKT